MSEESNPQDVKGIEAALGALAPAPVRIDRDGLMFRAGQASTGRHRWAWPAAAGALAAVAATLAMVLVPRPRPEPEQRIVYVEVEKKPVKVPEKTEPPVQVARAAQERLVRDDLPRARIGYFKLRDELLRWGLDALASPPVAITIEPPLTIEKLLGEAPKRHEVTPWFPLKNLFMLGDNS